MFLISLQVFIMFMWAFIIAVVWYFIIRLIALFL